MAVEKVVTIEVVPGTACSLRTSTCGEFNDLEWIYGSDDRDYSPRVTGNRSYTFMIQSGAYTFIH